MRCAILQPSTLPDLPRSVAQVSALLDKYVQRKIWERVLAVARTETMAALNGGQVASWEAAREKGLLSKDAEKEWITTPDVKLCPVCAPMEGVKVPINAKCAAGGPPGHVRCRCTVALA
jgi:hypothetical protein